MDMKDKVRAHTCMCMLLLVRKNCERENVCVYRQMCRNMSKAYICPFMYTFIVGSELTMQTIR